MGNPEPGEGNKISSFWGQETGYKIFCALYVLGLLAFAILMFETREELILLYLPFTFAIFVLNPGSKIVSQLGKRKYKVLLFLIIGATIATALYFRSQYYALQYERLGDYAIADYLFGLVLIVLTLYLTWVEYGAILPILALLALFYAKFGNLFPGFFYHKGISAGRMIAICATEFSSGDGVLGSLPQIAITWIAIFTIFAGIAAGFGTLDFIVKVSYFIFRKFRYGIPQIAVISSMIFGMFSGSGAANVAGTGSFTIPLMKRYGIPPRIAGAVESVASSGGQVMPPIMGAAAFVMASYLGKHYWQIAVIGFLPAIIFYACVALAVYVYSRQYLKLEVGIEEGIPGSPMEKIGFGDGVPLVSAIIVLVLLMSLFWLDVMIAGFFMILAFLSTWLIGRGIRPGNKRELSRLFARYFVNGVTKGAQTTVEITIMMACIGIIVAVLVQTGLAQKLSFGIVEIAGGNREVLILLVGGLCTLFGMVATTVAAYILTVTLAAPILLDMGIPLLSTHFAVFYFSMMGLITPPVAPCCAVASGIARAGFLEICWASIKIGFVMLLLPFVFFYHPDLVHLSKNTVKEFFLTGLGAACLILGVNLHLKGFRGILKRVGYIAVGLMTLFPNPTTGYLGMVLSGLFLVWELYRLRDKDPSSLLKP